MPSDDCVYWAGTQVTVRMSPDEARELLREIMLARDHAGVLHDEPGRLGRLQSALARALEDGDNG